MKVLNFGSANIDYIYDLAHFVQPGETIKSKTLTKNSGGKGLNQSIAVAKAGTNIYHAGCVGKSDGEYLMDILKKYNVNCDYIKLSDNLSGHAIIQVTDTGENSIILYSGANNEITEEYIDDVLSNFEDGDFCILQNEISNVDYIIEKAHQKNMCIFFNPSPFCDEILNYPLQYVDYLLLNEIEASQITKNDNVEEIITSLSEMFSDTKIVLTLGERGVVYSYKNERYSCGIFNIDVVDTTAAGDTFTGYFVSSVIKGYSVDKALETASCASAIAVSKKGAAQSIPFFDDVQNFLKTNKPKDFNIEK